MRIVGGEGGLISPPTTWWRGRGGPPHLPPHRQRPPIGEANWGDASPPPIGFANGGGTLRPPHHVRVAPPHPEPPPSEPPPPAPPPLIIDERVSREGGGVKGGVMWWGNRWGGGDASRALCARTHWRSQWRGGSVPPPTPPPYPPPPSPPYYAYSRWRGRACIPPTTLVEGGGREQGGCKGALCAPPRFAIPWALRAQAIWEGGGSPKNPLISDERGGSVRGPLKVEW
nr:hypothetical protein [Morchella crassipes]